MDESPTTKNLRQIWILLTHATTFDHHQLTHRNNQIGCNHDHQVSHDMHAANQIGI